MEKAKLLALVGVVLCVLSLGAVGIALVAEEVVADDPLCFSSQPPPWCTDPCHPDNPEPQHC